MKKIFVLIFYLLITSGICNSYAAEYSLDNLYRIALERSRTIKIAEDDLYISAREKDKALATLLPTLSAFGKHTRYTEEKTNNDFILQPEYTNEWGFRLDQSFSVSGRELTAYNMAKIGIIKSETGLDAVKAEYLIDVASSYYDTLKSKKALEIAGVNVKRLTKHRDAARKRLEVGEVTKTVLLRAEAELSGALSNLIKAENYLKLARTILAERVGITSDFELINDHNSTDTGVVIAGCAISDLDCLKNMALSAKQELRALSIERDIAEQKVKFSKGSYWPTLSIEGVYYKSKDDPETAFVLRERIYGGIQLDFPFFEGGLRRAEVREAKAELRQIDAHIINMKKETKIKVEKYGLEYITLSAMLSQIKAEVTYATDNYNAVTKQFQYGLADSIDVIDANSLLITSESKLANAEYDQQLAILKLRRATGTFLKTIMGKNSTEVSEAGK